MDILIAILMTVRKVYIILVKDLRMILTIKRNKKRNKVRII